MTTPYERATSGVSARDEITKLLRRFGCASIGFLDDYENHEVLLVFEHRGRKMQLRASAKGWAALWKIHTTIATRAVSTSTARRR